MRLRLLVILSIFPFILHAQNNYDCFYQPSIKSNWKYLGPKNEPDELDNQRFGNVTAISINPKNDQEIFVGSPTGSLFHTTNRGKSWHCLTDQNDLPIIGVNDVLVDYTKQPYHILIATGCSYFWNDAARFGIFKSTDGGKTWQRKKTKEEGIFSDPYFKFTTHKNKIFARASASIISSDDYGDTWKTELQREEEFDGLKFTERNIRYFHYEASQNKIYFGTSQKYTKRGNEPAKLFVLDLATKELEDLSPMLQKSYKTEVKDNGYEAIQILPYENGKLLFAASHFYSREGFIYEYDIKKNKIVDYEVPNASKLSVSLFWYSGHRLNKVNNRIRYLGDVYLHKSIDGGQTYKKLFGYSLGSNNVPHVDVRNMIITKHSADGESDHIYLGTDGGLSFSDDGGKTWENLNGPELQITQIHGVGSSPFTGTISIGTQDNSIISYLPQKNKWIFNIRGDGYDVAYSPNIPKVAYGQYNSRQMARTNNDVVPFSRGMYISAVENANNRKTLVTHPNGDLYFGGQNLFYLEKGKREWKEFKTPLSHRALDIAVSESNPEVIYMSGLWFDLVKSSDGGKTWEKLNDNLIIDGAKQNDRIMSICVSPYDEDRVWVGFGYVGSHQELCKNTIRVIESTDGGKTWQNYSNGLPTYAIQDLVFYKGTYASIFAATDQGVYYKKGAGYKWQRFGDNLPHSLIGELNINYCRGKLLSASYGRGLWETDLPAIDNKNPEIIRREKVLSAPEGEAIALTRDIKLRRRGKLIISCPVHLPKGGKITVCKKKQVSFTEGGKIVNDCGEEIDGIVLE